MWGHSWCHSFTPVSWDWSSRNLDKHANSFICSSMLLPYRQGTSFRRIVIKLLVMSHRVTAIKRWGICNWGMTSICSMSLVPYTATPLNKLSVLLSESVIESNSYTLPVKGLCLTTASVSLLTPHDNRIFPILLLNNLPWTSQELIVRASRPVHRHPQDGKKLSSVKVLRWCSNSKKNGDRWGIKVRHTPIATAWSCLLRCHDNSDSSIGSTPTHIHPMRQYSEKAWRIKMHRRWHSDSIGNKP